MTQKSKFLMAAGAVCALALTACGGGEGDSTASEEPTPVEAPDDYTLETAESTLAAATVGGEEMSDVGPAETDASVSEEAGSMLEMMMSMVEADPEECKDPLFSAVSAGLMDGDGLSENLSDLVAGSTAADDVVSVQVMESRDAADQAVLEMQSELDGCGEVVLNTMGEESTVTSSTSSAEVEGAGNSFTLSGETATDSTASPSGEGGFGVAYMSVGNLVVTVAPSESVSVVESEDDSTSTETTSSEDDLQTTLDEIATAFVDGPVEPTESSEPTGTSSPSES